MQYKVLNLLYDMKLLRNGKVFVIKKNTESTVSATEYQYLSQVYGANLKGQKVMEVRVTHPVQIIAPAQEIKKSRKRKKS